MTIFEQDQWVRMPKELGYGEGKIQNMIPTGDDDNDPIWVIAIPTRTEYVYVRGSWLTAIDEPTGYPEAPRWNPTCEGHAEVTRNQAEVALVVAFIKQIEFGNTEQNCWCPWTPMQVENRMGRLRTGEHPQCPVHTKEGYLFGFIDHVRRAFADKPIGAMEFMARSAREILEAGGQIEEITTEPGKAGIRWVE